MPTVEHSVTIARPAEDVFAYAADPGNVPFWQPSVVAMRQTTPGAFGVGSRIAQTRRLAGRSFDLVVECTAYEPGGVLGLRIVDGPVRGEVLTCFDPAGRSTRLRMSATVMPSGLLRVAAGALAAAARAELVWDCRRLREILEGRTPATRSTS